MLNKKAMKELLKELEKEKNNLENKAFAYSICVDSMHLDIKNLHKTIDELREEVNLYKQKYAEEIEKRVALAEKLLKYV